MDKGDSMLLKDFYTVLRDAGNADSAVTVPKDIHLYARKPDAIAADILTFLHEKHPDLTGGEAEEALRMAHWWFVFIGSIAYEAPNESEATDG